MEKGVPDRVMSILTEPAQDYIRELKATRRPYSPIPDWTGERRNAVFSVPVGHKDGRLSNEKDREALADGLERVYVAAGITYEGTKVAIKLIAIDTYRAEHNYKLATVATKIDLVAWDKKTTGMGLGALNAGATWLIQQIWDASASQFGPLSSELYDGLFKATKEDLVGIKGEFVRHPSGQYNIKEWGGWGFFLTTHEVVKAEVRGRLTSQPGKAPPFKVSMLGRGALFHWVLMHMAGLHNAPSESFFFDRRFFLIDEWRGYLTNNDSDHEALLAELGKLPTPEKGTPLPIGILREILEDIHTNQSGDNARMMYGPKNEIRSKDLTAAHKDITMPKVPVEDIIKTTLRPLRLRLYLRKLQDDIRTKGIKTEVAAQKDRPLFLNGIYDGYQPSVEGIFHTLPEYVQAQFSQLLV